MNDKLNTIQKSLGELYEECEAYEKILNPDNIQANAILLSLKEKIQKIVNEAEVPMELPNNDFHITKREGEVLALLIDGLLNKEIAYQMGITDRTVQFHLKSLFTKVDVSSRTELVAFTLKNKIILK
ncbi:MAG: response regulator transcription factor [Bacteriovoracaceae bacterium]|nr:response regulator transcription factor [Bacteriovoracaceae bacterium]